MSDFQSNYPRVQVAISDEKADLVAVKSSGDIGKLAVYVIALVLAFQTIGPWLGYSTHDHRSVYGFSILVLIAVLPIHFINLYKWGSRAHYALCLLRGYRPSISSSLVGFGCAASFFLAGVPVWLTFDFLITHSDPDTKTSPTLSWSPSALRFLVPYTLWWMWLAVQRLPIWSLPIHNVMVYGRNILLFFAVFSGAQIISRVDQNLRTLARHVRERAELISSV